MAVFNFKQIRDLRSGNLYRVVDEVSQELARSAVNAANGALQLAENLRARLDALTALPNPFSLVINGTSYNGSEAVELTISGGPQGPQGETGPQGPQGETGPQGPQGETGPAGQDGTDGADGEDATITIGTVSTLAAGENATVTNSGTPSAAVLDFGIPQGPQGVPGVAGATGPQGTPGTAATITVGNVSAVPYTQPPTVVNSGNQYDAVLDFEIPSGRAATVALGSVGQSASGSSPAIWNSGTDSDAILNFLLPKSGYFYDVGDTYALTKLDIGGYITSGATQARFFIPVPLISPNVTAVRVTGTAVFRQWGYVCGTNASTPMTIGPSDVANYGITPAGVDVWITVPSTGATNNATLAAEFTNLTLVFS